MSDFEWMVIPSLRIPADKVKGTKSYNARGILPTRMRYMHPAAVPDFYALGPVVVSDMARTPDAQIRARRTRAGSQTPDRSGHVRLLSIDLDVSATYKSLGITGSGKKRQLDEHMAEHNWHCHRRDHQRAREDWHYNWLPNFRRWYLGESRTNAALQRYIDHLFGKWHKMPKRTIQLALRSISLYGGAIDGRIGPLTKTATEMFQRAYFLRADGIPGPKTQRMLAVVTATYSGEHE